jgi:hypothetical protein
VENRVGGDRRGCGSRDPDRPSLDVGDLTIILLAIESIFVTTPFVPADSIVPDSVSGPGFRGEPLDAVHNERDHAAWMASIDHIVAAPGSESWAGSWPVPMISPGPRRFGPPCAGVYGLIRFRLFNT